MPIIWKPRRAEPGIICSLFLSSICPGRHFLPGAHCRQNMQHIENIDCSDWSGACFVTSMIFDTMPSLPPPSLSPFADRKGESGSSAVAPSPAADDGEFSFLDLLDVVNPLQHIPIVSTLYREISGDTIGNPARIAGGFLFGGVIGLAGSVANAIVDETTGKDVGDHLVGLVGGGRSPAEADTAASLRFERARDAYERLDRSGIDPLLDHVVEAP